MRITDGFRTRTVIQDLNFSRERMTKLQEQLASGQRVNRPSDDPLAVSRGMRLRTTLENNIQYEKNIDDTVGYLSTTEAALNDINEILLSVRDIALQGANDATAPREDLAEQLELVLQNLLEISNSKFRGRYIFGGTETQSLPFYLDQNVINQNLSQGIVDYRGNDKTFQRQLNENTVIDLNLTGSEVFDRSTDGAQLIHINDFNDPTTFAAKLRDAADPLSEFLKGQFSTETQQLLDEYTGEGKPATDLQNALVDEINQLLKGRNIYNEARFAEVELSQEAQDLIDSNPQGNDLIRLNRVLLEEAYPDELAKSYEDGVSLFQVIWNLRNRLLSDDTDAIRNTLNEIDVGIDQVMESFLAVGVRKQLAYFNHDRFLTQDILVRERLSRAMDTDYGTAFVQFKAEENALNSALSAGARVISPSLLDFLK